MFEQPLSVNSSENFGEKGNYSPQDAQRASGSTGK